jgi:hypothetical protein
MTRTNKRPAITVTRDDDGGLTLHDPQSGLVLSVIATHPDANGPRGLFVECYRYKGGDVLWQDATLRVARVPDAVADNDGRDRHPTIAFYGETER